MLKSKIKYNLSEHYEIRYKCEYKRQYAATSILFYLAPLHINHSVRVQNSIVGYLNP